MSGADREAGQASLSGKAEPLSTGVSRAHWARCLFGAGGRETQVKEGDAEAAGEPDIERKKRQGGPYPRGVAE